MLNIKILGPGCFNCFAVEEAVVVSLEQLARHYPKLEVKLELVQDPVAIRQHAIWNTPGLMINGKVLCAGRIPSDDEVLRWLTSIVEEAA